MSQREVRSGGQTTRKCPAPLASGSYVAGEPDFSPADPRVWRRKSDSRVEDLLTEKSPSRVRRYSPPQGGLGSPAAGKGREGRERLGRPAEASALGTTPGAPALRLPAPLPALRSAPAGYPREAPRPTRRPGIFPPRRPERSDTGEGRASH